MFRRKLIYLIFASLLFIAACSSNQSGLMESPDQERKFLLGTVVQLSVYDENKQDSLERAIELIESLEYMISDEIDESEVSEINRNAGREAVQVSPELYELIEESIDFSKQSNGRFDVTVGALTNLWRIGFDDARKPSQEEIDQVLSLISYEKIELNPDDQSVYLSEVDIQLDFGAIAKGYIADRVRDLLIEEEVTSAIIDIGGNIFVLGNRPTGEDWSVGVQNPFLARGEIVGRLFTSDQSIVTSGIYERYLEVDGEQYHHLLDPTTGYPFDNQIAGVTIVSHDSIDGDALSTLVFAEGLEQGLEFIEAYSDVEAVFVTKDREIYLSSGLVDEFELIDDDFEVIEE